MKSHDPLRISQAETAQLVLLQSLFSLRESREVIFQGGAALRWFYGGMRFSEDLDFVSPLSREEMAALMESGRESIKRQLTAAFGEGSFAIDEKRSPSSSYMVFVRFRPFTAGSKIAVKLDFEKLAPRMKPETEKKSCRPLLPWPISFERGPSKRRECR